MRDVEQMSQSAVGLVRESIRFDLWSFEIASVDIALPPRGEKFEEMLDVNFCNNFDLKFSPTPFRPNIATLNVNQAHRYYRFDFELLA